MKSKILMTLTAFLLTSTSSFATTSEAENQTLIKIPGASGKAIIWATVDSAGKLTKVATPDSDMQMDQSQPSGKVTDEQRISSFEKQMADDSRCRKQIRVVNELISKIKSDTKRDISSFQSLAKDPEVSQSHFEILVKDYSTCELDLKLSSHQQSIYANVRKSDHIVARRQYRGLMSSVDDFSDMNSLLVEMVKESNSVKLANDTDWHQESQSKDAATKFAITQKTGADKH